MDMKQIQLRCDDGQEAVVFSKYTFASDDINYEITVEDSFVGGEYQGLIGRIKRAWKAFTGKPLYYTGIFTEDTDKMRKFLNDCLDIMSVE